MEQPAFFGLTNDVDAFASQPNSFIQNQFFFRRVLTVCFYSYAVWNGWLEGGLKRSARKKGFDVPQLQRDQANNRKKGGYCFFFFLPLADSMRKGYWILKAIYFSALCHQPVSKILSKSSGQSTMYSADVLPDSFWWCVKGSIRARSFNIFHKCKVSPKRMSTVWQMFFVRKKVEWGCLWPFIICNIVSIFCVYRRDMNAWFFSPFNWWFAVDGSFIKRFPHSADWHLPQDRMLCSKLSISLQFIFAALLSIAIRSSISSWNW